MAFGRFSISWLVVMCCALVCQPAAGDGSTARSVRFSRRTPSAGDVGAVSVNTTTSMEVSVHSGEQLVHQNSTRVHRAQQRTLRLTHVEPGVRMAGEVTYRQADQSVVQGEKEAESVRQPVVGKTYRVERQGENLLITTASGDIPPQDEFQIVWHNMEAFGKPNPLTSFLDGRTVAVGDVLNLPTDAAMQLLAFGDDLVQVERFSLTLEEVREAGQGLQAVFRAFVSSRSHGRSQMGMQVEGKLIVDAATCRVVLLELAGPVGMTETHSNGPDTYLVTGRGKIHVAMRGEFRVAK